MNVPALRAALLSWYDAQARDLPWRVGPAEHAAGARADPYRVWLSEVMLQQTTVPHATPYFLDFTRRWPTVRDLAAAPDAEVMSAWAGLGYYARARNLLACARAVAGDHAGVFPATEDALRALPGVGAYTAAAVAAIAFDRAANVVDGNVERVMSRLFAVETPLPDAKPELKALSGGLVADHRPGDWAQALMDLGATVCLPRQPRCAACPVAGHCRAFLEDAAPDYPRRVPPVPKREQDWTILLVRCGERLLARRRPKGLLGGLYEFAAVEGHCAPVELERIMAREGFVNPRVVKRLPDSKHVFTHLVWRMQGWLAECDGPPEGFTPLDAAALAALPFPSALRVYREIAGESLQ